MATYKYDLQTLFKFIFRLKNNMHILSTPASAQGKGLLIRDDIAGCPSTRLRTLQDAGKRMLPSPTRLGIQVL